MMRIASLARPVALVALGICLGLPPAAAEPSRARRTCSRPTPTLPRPAMPTLSPRRRRCSSPSTSFSPTRPMQNMLAARAAWVAARIPYMQTEAFRFGNTIVDDWEGKVNSWPLDEGLIDYVVRLLRHRFARERALRRQRHRQHLADHRRQEARHLEDHQGAARRHAAGGWRRRGQCRHRLSRHRVSALGPGPERHRPGQRQSPGERLRHQELHRRQLRPPRAISPRRHRPAGRRPCLDGGAMGPRRRGAQDHRGRHRRGRPHRDPHRARQPVLWRARRRAHEARPDDPRSRGGA